MHERLFRPNLLDKSAVRAVTDHRTERGEIGRALGEHREIPVRVHSTVAPVTRAVVAAIIEVAARG
jgi:hypothetical protein